MKSNKVLFFYPSNKRTIALETLLIELRKKNYEVIILTTCEEGDLHAYLETLGFSIFTNKMNSKGFRYYLSQVFFLISFCRKHKINFILSHLQQVNLIAVLAQYFIKAKVIVFRHHFRTPDVSDGQIKLNSNEVLFDKIINKLAYKIVVPSSGVYNGIKNTERINTDKLFIIPYIYDFSKYATPIHSGIEKIRDQYPCKLRLIMVSRLIKLKRHHIVFPVIKDLINEGYNIKMLVLDEGPEKENLDKYILENNLQNNIIMLGFRTDFVNFMAAADLLVQPSLTDASNSAAKEMAVLGKTIAVSSGVGDYNDYVKNNENGYLIPVHETAVHLKNIIIDAYNNPKKLDEMAGILKKDVLLRFGLANSEKIIDMYVQLMR